MLRKYKFAVGAVLGVAVLGMGGLAIASGKERGTLVRSEVVERRDLVSVVTASGVIQPKRKVDISADVMGRVIEVAVEEGQWVERGDLLLRIDPTSFQAAARRAEAAVAQAQAQAATARANLLQAESALRRAEQLSSSQEGLISSEALEQARTQVAVTRAQYEAGRFGVAQAQAALAESREQLAKTTIRAPMSGRVTRLNIQAGETAVIGTMNNPGSLLLTVADLAEMEARVKVDETDVPTISIGDSAAVRIDAFPNRIFAGRVTRIGNSAISSGMPNAQGQAVDFEVIVTLQDPPETLRPDLSTTADIVTDTRGGALTIPIIALTVRDSTGRKPGSGDADRAPGRTTAENGRSAQRQEVEGVFVIEEGKAKWVPVRVGIAGDRYFEVISGLSGGETIVAGSYQAIRDLESGTVVRLPSAESSGGDAPRGARTEG
jgi:HlyD family secretion protein